MLHTYFNSISLMCVVIELPLTKNPTLSYAILLLVSYFIICFSSAKYLYVFFVQTDILTSYTKMLQSTLIRRVK